MSEFDPDATKTVHPSLAATRSVSIEAAVLSDAPIISGYELHAEIGRGGMGVVYRARQIAANRIVAVKMIPAGEFASDSIRRRFRVEAESAAGLDHPGIVPIYEIGEAAVGPYFSMKWIPGRSLKEALADPNWAPDIASRIAMLAKVARAVQHAHQRGVIHRDLKPGNILLDESNEPHIADFGLAKRVEGGESLTQSGAIFGTPAYMPPEQAGGDSKSVTTLADVYSLGAILYELLAGRPPFIGDGAFDVARKVIAEKPDSLNTIKPGVDRDLEAVCLKCLSKAPAERYESVSALADDLERWRRKEPLSVRPASLASLVWHWLQSNVRTTVWVVLIGIICSMLTSVVIAFQELSSLFIRASETFDKFPSVEKPWLLQFDWARIASMPNWLVAIVSLAILFLSVGCLGLITDWVTKPRDVSSSLFLGFGLGFVSGQTFLFTIAMPMTVVAFVVVPRIADFTTVSQGCFAQQEAALDPLSPPSNPSAGLIARYPDLLQSEKPSSDFLAWMIANQVVGSFYSIWVGGFLSWIGAMGLCVMQTVIAGYLRRINPRFRWIFPRYLALTLPAYPLLGIAITLDVTGSQTLPTIAYSVVAYVLVGIGLYRRWRIWIVCLGLGYLLLGFRLMSEIPLYSVGYFALTGMYFALGLLALYLWSRPRNAARLAN